MNSREINDLTPYSRVDTPLPTLRSRLPQGFAMLPAMEPAALCRGCMTTWQGSGRCPRLPQPAHPRPSRTANPRHRARRLPTPSTPRSKSATTPLRDRPVIVGGGKRGVVSTACYIARIKWRPFRHADVQGVGLCPERRRPAAMRPLREACRKIRDQDADADAARGTGVAR